jgi:hypothetical protein
MVVIPIEFPHEESVTELPTLTFLRYFGLISLSNHVDFEQVASTGRSPRMNSHVGKKNMPQLRLATNTFSVPLSLPFVG